MGVPVSSTAQTPVKVSHHTDITIINKQEIGVLGRAAVNDNSNLLNPSKNESYDAMCDREFV